MLPTPIWRLPGQHNIALVAEIVTEAIVASPDQQGPSSASYVYRITAPDKATAVSEPGESDHTLAWILLGLGLVAAVPAADVIWAHS